MTVDVHALGHDILNILDDLGFAHIVAGVQIGLSFRRVMQTSDGKWAFYVIDDTSMPPGTKLSRIKAAIPEIQGRIRHETYFVNKYGLTIAVKLVPDQPLPAIVSLDPENLPPDEYPVILGADHESIYVKTLPETGHILVGGATRSGKSTWVHSILYALAARHTPEELRLVIIDPKGVEFLRWSGLSHLHGWPIANDLEKANVAMQRVIDEIDSRKSKFGKVLARNLDEYNTLAEDENLPVMLVVIDEFTDLAVQMGLRSDFYRNLIRVSSMGAGYGVYLLLATQNPKAEVLNTLIRGNCMTRVAFRTSTASNSDIILGHDEGQPSADTIPLEARGRMIVVSPSSRNRFALQGLIVTLEQIDELVSANQSTRKPIELKEAPPSVPLMAQSLTDLETAMLRYAATHNKGGFAVNPMYNAFKEHTTQAEVTKMAASLQSRGYLTEARSNKPRCLTMKAAKELGIGDEQV